MSETPNFGCCFKKLLPLFSGSRCDFHLAIFIYTKWNCEISVKQQLPLTPYNQKIDCVGHNSPLQE